MFPSASSNQSRLRNILSALRGPSEEPARLDALTQLCDYLSVGTEDSMVSFSIDSFVPALVALLGEGNSPDAMLLAARALTHMIDALPASAASIAHHGAAPPLCANLLSIEYIDLAEQSLAALEKLSFDFPQPIVRAGGFAAALLYIDFFSTGVQRMAAATACNMCRNPPSDAMDKIVDVLPKMMDLLQSDDQRIRESAMLGFSRLADSFRTASDKLETLCGDEWILIDHVIALIVPTSPPALAPQSYSAALRLLSTLCRGSAGLSGRLLASEPLLQKIRALLSAGSSSQAMDCLTLADALLPESAPDPVDSTSAAGSAVSAASSRASRRRRSSSSAVAYAAIDSGRRGKLAEDPGLLAAFGYILLPGLLSFYHASADSAARRSTLSILTKLLALSPPDVLRPLVLDQSLRVQEISVPDAPHFSPFVAGLLGENCSLSEALAGLTLVHHALAKLPEIKMPFAREGVVFELMRLRTGASSSPNGEEGEPTPTGDLGVNTDASGHLDTVVTSHLGTVATSHLDTVGPAGTGSPDAAAESSAIQASGSAGHSVSAQAASFNAFASSLAGSLNAAGVGGLAPLLHQAQEASERNGNNGGPVGPGGIFHGIGSSRLPLRVASLRHSTSVPEVTAVTVADVAKSIVSQHFGDTLAESQGCDPILDELSDSVGILQTSSSSPDSATFVDALNSLSRLLANEAGLTTFELSRSGVVDALAAFFLAEGHRDAVRTDRTVAFVRALNNHQDKDPFGLLVARVLGVFAAEEKLPLCVSDSTGSQSGASLGSGLRQLAQPFKLCLKRAPANAGGADLRDYSHHVVLIEPLATMLSVQDFLWNRVQPQGASGSGRIGHGSSSRHAGALNEDSGVGLPHVVNEMVLDEAEATVDPDEEDGGDDDVDDDHAVPDLRDDDDAGSEEGHEHSGGEEGMFELDEEGGHEGEHDREGDEDGSRSDEDFSSGSEGVISGEHEVDDQNADLDGPPSFGMDQLGTSLPPVELDHDALAQALVHSPHPASELMAARNASSGSGRAASRARGIGGPRGESLAGTAAPLRTYAAALASGVQRSRVSGPSSHSGSELGSHGRRMGSSLSSVPKLTFSLNGREIPKDSSILHAVLHSRGDGLTVGPRLWNDVYTLTYSKASVSPGGRSDSEEAGAGVTSPTGSASAGAGSRPARRSRRLSGRSVSSSPALDLAAIPPRRRSGSSSRARQSLERRCDLNPADVLDRPNAFVPRLVVSDGVPEAIRSIIYILKHLNWIYNSMRAGSVANVSDTSTVCLEQAATLSFVSQKVTAKLQRQLSDLLALCGGAIPKWCHSLARDASFLFPFEARLVLFQSTALGVARALHLLQLRADFSSSGPDHSRHGSHHRSQAVRDTEARISRIQRQKVRIHRSRVLESAVRVMSMYATHGTVLEVEYFDEVGTGLGPTLEFYTLVSRELQRCSLKLWRSKHLEDSKPKQEIAIGSRTGFVDGRIVSSLSSDVADIQAAGSSSARRSSVRTRRRDREAAARADSCGPRTREGPVSDCPVEYVVSTGAGLMPGCIPCVDIGDAEYADRLSYFPFMGRLVAKALSDGRLLDLRFSRIFCKLLLACCNIILKKEQSNLCGVDDALAGSLGENSTAMLNYLGQVSDAELWREFADGSPGIPMMREVDPQLASSLQVILDMLNGDSRSLISDLCLTFVVPGGDCIELVANGKDTAVTEDNALEYVAAVVRYVLCSGVRRQAEAFLRGFSDVLDLKSLLLFRAEELELLMCGPAFENWSVDFLVQATRCDHGYRHESPAVVSLLKVLSELGAEDQRRFVLFATGSPALPVGGLLGLNPRLTIVKRTPEGGRGADECLPTVMTCTNYFKLPDYSSFEITKSRLLYALREGQGSFHLS